MTYVLLIGFISITYILSYLGCRKGRYTYEKRTQDTKEFRRIQASENVSKHFELEQCSEMVAMLATQFERNFPFVCHAITGKSEMELRIKKLLGDDDRKGRELDHVLFSPGHSSTPEARAWFDTADRHLRYVSSNAEVQRITNAVGNDMVFDNWALRAEELFHGLANFLKCLSGFSDLQLDDKIILLKEGRIESHLILQ